MGQEYLLAGLFGVCDQGLDEMYVLTVCLSDQANVQKQTLQEIENKFEEISFRKKISQEGKYGGKAILVDFRDEDNAFLSEKYGLLEGNLDHYLVSMEDGIASSLHLGDKVNRFILDAKKVSLDDPFSQGTIREYLSSPFLRYVDR